MTDPGFYSMHHLHFAPPPCPLAMPLSRRGRVGGCPDAATGGRGASDLFLGQPAVFEKELLDAAGVSAPLIPPHGTVAATAIQLALASTSAAVIIAGLDMGSRDLLSHARPNAFDSLLLMEASRLKPHTSLLFQRAATLGSLSGKRGNFLRVSPALRTYAGWFDSGLAAAKGRVHRLMPSAVPLAGMIPLDVARAEKSGTGAPLLSRRHTT